jgi:colicin import membrane protein
MTKEIKQFSPFEKELAEFKGKYIGVVYDFSVKKNEKQARSDRHTIGKTISALDAIHKDLKAPMLEKTKQLDSRRKEIKDGLLEVQEDIKAQIRKHEKVDLDRIEQIKCRIEAIKHPSRTFDDGMDLSEIKSGLEWVQSVVIDETFEEFEKEALFTKIDSAMILQTLMTKVTAAKQEETERRELREEQAETARKEREENIRKQAQLDAEEASKNQIAAAIAAKKEAEEAAEKAELDKVAAVQKAKDDAAAETKRIADKKEFEENLERLAQKRRQEDIDVRISIETRIIDALVDQGLGLMDAKLVIDAVNLNKVPHLTIKY